MLTELLKQGPGQMVAFLPEADSNTLAETLVAFANTDGGTIFIGTTLDGKPNGRVTIDEVEGVLTQAIIQCRPPVEIDWQHYDLPNGAIVVLQVARSIELHALQDGRVLIRYRTENRPMSGEAIRHLAATKSTADFETDTVPASSLLDFDKNTLELYLARRAERGRSLNERLEDHLIDIGAMTEDGTATIAGLLLFGKKPQSYLPQSGLVFVKFRGKDPRGKGGLAGYERRVEVTGPLPHVLEKSWELVWESIRVEAVVDGLKREEIPEYPRFAIREALINALCHRDYRLKGRRVEVRLYEDRLEVISPGGLPGYMTLDNLVEEHFSRNPRIVAGLFEWGYIEELGLGIDRMIEEMLEYGHPPPEFEATSYLFKVTLFNAVEHAPALTWDVELNDRQVKGMTFVHEHGRLTIHNFQSLCNDVSLETLRLDLVDLVDKGLLLKIGDKRGTFYIIK
ncbi:MAG: ATP-binding protein [Chloroflexota bacterium]